jgi:light-regulated signal transduction histidine kinase (bacteriophytochrome)
MNLEAPIAESAAVLTAEPLPVVQADEQLARVFQNLVENALKYRSADPPRIHVAAERAANEWTFRVSDNGIGFDMQYADRVFAAFQRLHSASAYEGSGIGLAICKRTIERYGGRMWVKSAPGEGSTFYFTVPANKAS